MLVSQTPLRPYTTGSATLTTTLTYLPGANGSKTGMIASYRNGTDDAYTYTYDANGNIVSVTKGSLSFTYTYDAANQLVRENLYYGSGNSNNATYTYEYDAWGNILNKKEYAYTTGTLGTVINTVSYGYTDSQWGDLLTSFDGLPITYDAMGNMRSYGRNIYIWEGKQLRFADLSGMAGYAFEYDDNGLRTRKKILSPQMEVVEVTDYYYNGSVLIGMKIGTGSTAKVLRFSYDASGNVVAVDYSEDGGTNYTTYYYLRNAQNDIVKIVDSTGTTVVEYIYDSWGKIVSSTGSLANTVGTYQPFRYRGYVCDDELGLYYLQSRYYDPTICRFISADVYLSTGQGVIGHNAFTYCGNNPVVRIDASGTAFSILDYLYDCINRLRNLLDGGASGGGAAYSCYAGPGGVFGEGADSPYSYRTYLGYNGDGYTAYTLGIYGGPPTSQVPGGSTSHGEIPVAEVGQCFIAGTLIQTEEGQKPIEEISEGDLVYSTDPETGESDYKRVVQTFERETDETVDVTFEGETVTTTPNHPFYVPQKGWTSAIELKAGDILITSNGEYVVVEKVQHEILEKPIKVFNFEVEDYHTYYVTSCSSSCSAFVFVHNSCEQQGNGHGEEGHKESIDKKIKELIESGLYRIVYGNRALNTAGLVGRQRPDIIALGIDGEYYIWEYASKSQMNGAGRTALGNKWDLMKANNPGAHFIEIVPYG